ncbi:hypothetical protein D3C72_1906360 [compost metagenome]
MNSVPMRMPRAIPLISGGPFAEALSSSIARSRLAEAMRDARSRVTSLALFGRPWSSCGFTIRALPLAGFSRQFRDTFEVARNIVVGFESVKTALSDLMY